MVYRGTCSFVHQKRTRHEPSPKHPVTVIIFKYFFFSPPPPPRRFPRAGTNEKGHPVGNQPRPFETKRSQRSAKKRARLPSEKKTPPTTTKRKRKTSPNQVNLWASFLESRLPLSRRQGGKKELRVSTTQRSLPVSPFHDTHAGELSSLRNALRFLTITIATPTVT